MLRQYRENPWVVCLLPFVVFMLVGSLEPAPPATGAREAEAVAPKGWLDLGIEYEHYPVVYAVKIALTVTAMIFVWPGYRKFVSNSTPTQSRGHRTRLEQHAHAEPWAWHPAVAVGVVGAVVWVALAAWQRQWMPRLAVATGSEWLRSLGQRSAFNPLAEMADQVAVGVRLFGGAIDGARAGRAGDRRVFLARVRDAVRDEGKMVGGTVWEREQTGGCGGDGAADVDAPARICGGASLVFGGDLADGANAEHLELRAGAWGDEFANGGLCDCERPMVADVKPFHEPPLDDRARLAGCKANQVDP